VCLNDPLCLLHAPHRYLYYNDGKKDSTSMQGLYNFSKERDSEGKTKYYCPTATMPVYLETEERSDDLQVLQRCLSPSATEDE
jgi:hypothetical protein